MFYITDIEVKNKEYIIFGYNENGRKEIKSLPFSNELYIRSDNGEYEDLFGVKYESKQFETAKERQEFIKKMQNTRSNEFLFSEGVNPNFGGDVCLSTYFLANYFEKENILNDDDKIQEYIQHVRKNQRTFFVDIEFYGHSDIKNLKKSMGYINVLTVIDSKTRNVFTFGVGKDWNKPDDINELKENWGINKIYYKNCKDEKELLLDFAKLCNKMMPDVLSGWYSNGYDIPMILLQAEKNGLKPKEFSPINNGWIREKELYGNKVFRTGIDGIHLIDYQELYKTFNVFNQTSFSLDHISKIELKEGKLKFNDTVDKSIVGDFNRFADEKWDHFVLYNIKDVALLLMLDDKLNLINRSFGNAIASCGLIDSVMSPIRSWDQYIFMYLKRNNLVLNGSVDFQDKMGIYLPTYKAGFVKTVAEGLIPGRYKGIVSFDLNSEYPTIAISFDLSYENKITKENLVKYFPEVFEYWRENIKPMSEKKIWNTSFNQKSIMTKFQDLLKKYSLMFTPNHVFWKKTDGPMGIISSIFKKLYDDRVEVKELLYRAKFIDIDSEKEELYADVQLQKKNLLNSGTGVYANKYFRYCDIEFIEAITKTGRMEINYVSHYGSRYLYKKFKKEYQKYGFKKDNIDDICIYNDTDSTYFNMEPILNEIFNGDYEKLKEFADGEFQKVIDKILIKFVEEWNCKINYLGMKRELIASDGIWVAGKNYVLKVIDDSGKKVNKIKLKGVNLVKATTNPIISDKIKDEALDFIFKDDIRGLYSWLRKYKKEFKKLPLDILGISIGMKSDINKYLKDGKVQKGTPIHVRGAIEYNNLIERENIDYLPPITEGTKIKYISTKPKIIGSHVFSWIEPFPEHEESFNDIRRGIDWEKIWRKTVLDNINQLLEPIGEKINDLSTNNLF